MDELKKKNLLTAARASATFAFFNLVFAASKSSLLFCNSLRSFWKRVRLVCENRYTYSKAKACLLGNLLMKYQVQKGSSVEQRGRIRP